MKVEFFVSIWFINSWRGILEIYTTSISKKLEAIMIKRLFLAMVLTLALSFSAFAADNGFYLGLKFIDSIQSTGDISKGGGTITIRQIFAKADIGALIRNFQ